MLRVRSRLFLAVVPVAYLYARLSGGGLPYYLFYFFLLLVVFSYWWVRRIKKNLTVIYESNERVVERGDTLSVSVRLENQGLLPVPWVRVTDHTFETRELNSIQLAGIYVMTSYRARVMHYELEAERRGRYTLGPLRANFGDLFGTFEAVTDYNSRREILVFPRFTPLTHLPLPLRQPFGHVRTRQKAYEDPTEIAELRPMRPGDNPKKIHWKTTARKGEPFVREYELKATADVLLVLDLNEEAHTWDGTDSTLEKAVENAAAIGHYCLTHGYRTRVMGRSSQQWDTVFKPDPQGFRQFMEVLARVEETEGPQLLELLSPERISLPPGTTLLVLTSDPDPRLPEMLLRLKNRGYGVVLFFVHPEGYMPRGHSQRVSKQEARIRRLNDEGVPSYIIHRERELAEVIEVTQPRLRRWRSAMGGQKP